MRPRRAAFISLDGLCVGFLQFFFAFSLVPLQGKCRRITRLQDRCRRDILLQVVHTRKGVQVCVKTWLTAEFVRESQEP